MYRRSALRGCEKERGALLLAPRLRLAAALPPSRLLASLSVADTNRLSSDLSALRALGLPPCTCAQASAYSANLAYVFIFQDPRTRLQRPAEASLVVAGYRRGRFPSSPELALGVARPPGSQSENLGGG